MKTKLYLQASQRIIFLILFCGTTIFAHSQTPTKFGGKEDKLNSISPKQVKVVTISIQNLNSYTQQYDILVDNRKIGTTQKLIKHQVLKLNVPVKINKSNTLETHYVCTLSVPNNSKEMFKTKICTKNWLVINV